MEKDISQIVEYTVAELKLIDKSSRSIPNKNTLDGKLICEIDDVDVLPGEIFRKFPMEPKHALCDFRDYFEKNKNIAMIFVSNLGRIKINDLIVPQIEKEKGFLYVDIGKNVYYKVYRLVAETWCKCPVEDSLGWHVHHVINNGHDNRAENLVWVTSEQHKEIHH